MRISARLFPLCTKVKDAQGRHFGSKMTTKYTIVLVRHGESEYNKENRFCGWFDADLSATGLEEAKNAGKVGQKNNAHKCLCRACILSFGTTDNESDKTNITLNACALLRYFIFKKYVKTSKFVH